MLVSGTGMGNEVYQLDLETGEAERMPDLPKIPGFDLVIFSPEISKLPLFSNW